MASIDGDFVVWVENIISLHSKKFYQQKEFNKPLVWIYWEIPIVAMPIKRIQIRKLNTNRQQDSLQQKLTLWNIWRSIAMKWTIQWSIESKWCILWLFFHHPLAQQRKEKSQKILLFDRDSLFYVFLVLLVSIICGKLRRPSMM